MPKTLVDLQVGDKLYFKEGEPKEYIIRNKRENFLIATSVGDELCYTIVDTAKGYCGPDDRVFEVVSYNTLQGREEALDHLLTENLVEKWNISQRNGASVEVVLDLERTLK